MLPGTVSGVVVDDQQLEASTRTGGITGTQYTVDESVNVLHLVQCRADDQTASQRG